MYVAPNTSSVCKTNECHYERRKEGRKQGRKEASKEAGGSGKTQQRKQKGQKEGRLYLMMIMITSVLT